MSMPLSGKKILVTRPVAQAKNLCGLLQQEGAEAVCFPTIEIQPITVNKQIMQLANSAEYFIFISANAVKYSVDILNDKKFKNKAVFAVGKKTREKLTKIGLTHVSLPGAPFNSESLLTLPELQNIKAKNIALIKGQGGRNLLEKTLKQRQANLIIVECYKRCLPVSPEQSVLLTLQQKLIDSILISSQESLDNLLQLTSAFCDITNTPVITGSERQKQHAQSQGFKFVQSIDYPDDKAYIKQLKQGFS
jgi:uroporphyrinogen-III synthase